MNDFQQSLYDGLKIQIVTVVFKKADGTERTMRCTLDPKHIPVKEEVEIEGKVKRTVKVNLNEVCRVYDVDIGEWRAFRWDSLLVAYGSESF